ncbi:metalloreductase STEAP4-like isoform X2 [Scomber scombrus]|uniref:Metalloreductase STEAP4-like isoform X2 n=1 Tax=Scomber scombrus TaxID=13677 RepID=A0AAV1N1T7_SCOSC
MTTVIDLGSLRVSLQHPPLLLINIDCHCPEISGEPVSPYVTHMAVAGVLDKTTDTPLTPAGEDDHSGPVSSMCQAWPDEDEQEEEEMEQQQQQEEKDEERG